MNRLFGLGRRGLLVLCMAAIATVALAACGDDDEDVPQLRIGYLADFSGALAEFGPEIQTGVDLAIKHINEAGGVNGQDVVVVVGDDRTDATAAVEEARRLVDVEGVHAIVGPLASGVAIAVAESVTGPAGIPTISPSATSPAVTDANDNGYLFRTTTSDAAQGVILAQMAEDEGITNVGVLYSNEAYGQGLARSFREAFSGTVTEASFELEQTTFLSELQAAAREGGDVLVAIGYPQQAQVFVREAIENDLFTQFLFVDGTKSEDLIGAIGADRLDGMKGTAPVGGPETEGTRAWNAAYEAEYGALPTRPFVREAYDATIAIALAAQRAGSVDGEAIRDALRAVAGPPGTQYLPGPEGIAAALQAAADGDDLDYEGAATSVNWDDNGDIATGYIGVWRYAGGTIEELETVAFDLNE